MYEGTGEAPKARRWLAWATAALLTAGVASAGVTGRDAPSEVDVVTAAGRPPGVVEVGPTVTLAPAAAQPPTVVPTTTVVRPPTTLPKAAVAVLKAIAGTAPPTTRAPQTVPSTTVAPETSTTATTTPPAPPSTSTTSSVVPAGATFTLVNEHSQVFVLAINGRAVELAPGTVTTVDLALAPNGSTALRVQAKDDDACRLDGPSRSFQAGGRYRVTITPGPTACNRFAAPVLDVSPPA